MKKTSFTLIIALMAVAVLFTGCKKEELNVNGNGPKVTLGVRMEPGNAKSYIDGVTPKWHANDTVNVNGGKYWVTGVEGNKAQIENVTAADNYRVVFPASIVTSISSTVNVTLPAVQTYTEVNGVQRVDAPMGGYGTSTNLSMHNLCSILKVNVTNTRNTPMILKKITVTAASALLSGTGTATVDGNTTDYIELTSGSTSVSLDFSTTPCTVPASGNKTFYIVAPEFGSQNVTISVFHADGLSKKSYEGVALAHNMITSVSVNNTNIIEGVLPGVFTVYDGQNVRQIYFSKGNLQYKYNTGWRFADNQYNYLGTWSSTSWVDLFGWGTWTGDNPNPRTTTTNNADYSWNDVDFTQTLTNATGTWRTLTVDEWSYLLYTRTTTSGVRYARAKVNNVKGLIILPDNWSTSYYTLQSTNTANAAYTTNEINSTTWTNSLEAHGAVFLPAAGSRREGTTVNDAGASGRYWSSTALGTDRAYGPYFNSDGQGTDDYNRYNGRSVRLVQNLYQNL